MGRFLVYFSYIGTRYSGLQRQPALVNGKPVATVQGALQDSLKRLRPANDCNIILSSRTDKGVHSLKNACHVDLEYPEEGKEYDPEIITNVMNYGLEQGLHDIRVLETCRVPHSFHARLSARERKYVYRLAHTVDKLKTEEEQLAMTSELKKYFMPRHKHPRLPSRDPLPVTDTYKVRPFREKLDISKLVAAAEACSGIHDYSSFTTPPKAKDTEYNPSPIKLLNIGVKRGHPFTHPLNAVGHDTTKHLEFWDIHVRARSFVYKQIRRLVGGMVLVAKNQISLDDLKDVLDRPQVQFRFASHMTLEESGLFLLDVAYDPEDLEFDESSCEIPSSHDLSPVGNNTFPADTSSEEEEKEIVSNLENGDGNCLDDNADSVFVNDGMKEILAKQER